MQSHSPDITEQFLSFVDGEATQAERLYILGDLFEAWIGDDDPNLEYARVKNALASLAKKGVACYFMHGNRDFLIADEFAAQTHCELLDDPVEIDLYGRRALLMHGDTLCTDDHEYQEFRKQVRNPAWQRQFLALSLQQRANFAQRARDASRNRGANTSTDIMDVNQAAVESIMRNHDIDLLIHGHTHRPGIHKFNYDGKTATRIVLGDWYTQSSVLRFDDQGFDLRTNPRNL